VKSIQTGVDKLVEVIGTAKRISLDDATKKLGVSAQVVQEWAEFLEREKLITVEYSFSKIWLCEKKLSKKEIATTAKEISSEKDAFARKIDSAIKSLEKDTSGFEEIKTEFVKIQSTVKDKITIVEQELIELEKYTNLKQNIDKIIEKQKKEYELSIAKTISEIQNTKNEFDTLNGDITKELKELALANEKIVGFQRSQTQFINTIKSAKESIKQIEKETVQEEEIITARLKKLNDLTSKASALQNRINTNKESPIAPLVRKISEDHKKIIQEQDELILKAKAKSKELQDYNELIEKIRGSFKGFFTKKIKTEQMIINIETEKINLNKSLQKLEERTKVMDLMSSSKEMKAQVTEIGNALKKYEENRSVLMKKIEDLISYIKS